LIYEIGNPSDPYTLEHSDVKIAVVAGLMLGQGMYALTDENKELVLPIFLGEGALAWLKATHDIGDLNAFIEEHRLEIADALDSVMIGNRADGLRMKRVLACITDPAEREKAKAAWLDERRSSTNNIGGYAAGMAKRLRAHVATGRG
jgi:hypothetical protein